MEINGFEVDEKNQYGLEEGAKRSICPKCSSDRKKDKEKCLLLDWEKGLGTCIHCDSVLQLHTYKRRGTPNKEYVKPPQVDSYNPPPQKVLDWFKDERGISEETIKELRITYGEEYIPQVSNTRGCIKYNYYMGGELVNIKYRDGAKNFKLFKDAEKVFYNIDSLVGHDSAVICEGENDVCAIHSAGVKNVVSVPNGASKQLDYLDNSFEYFEDKKKIILAVDNDEKGNILKQELIRRLGAEVCYLVDFKDCKDANEYLLKYGKEELKECLKQAKQVPLEGVSTLKDHEDELIDFFENGFKQGYKIGLPNFDEIFSTYTKQFIVITARPSVGKSLWVNQMCMGYNKNYGWKIAFASPESKPTYLHSSNLVRMAFNGMPKKEDIGTDRWNEAKEYVDDNFFHMEMDSFTLDNVLAKGEELVKRKGIRVLCIDPINKIRDKSKSSRTDDDYVVDYAGKVEAFCKRNDALVLLVAHPIKMFPDQQTGKYDMPTFNSIRGSEWWDVSPHGLALNRNRGDDITTVKVLKVKQQNLGQNEAECQFKWDSKSGLFSPCKDPEKEYMDSFKNVKMPWENNEF